MTEPRCNAWLHTAAADLRERVNDGHIHTLSIWTLSREWGVATDDVWDAANMAAAYHGVYIIPEPFQGLIIAASQPIRKRLMGGYEYVPEASRRHYRCYGNDAGLA